MNGKQVSIAVGAFVGLIMLIVIFVETKPKPAKAGDTQKSDAEATPPTQPTERPKPPEGARTGRPVVMPTVVPTSTGSAARSPTAEPSEAELRSLASEILDAAKRNDQAFFDQMKSPAVDADKTTLKIYEHNKFVGLIKDAAPKLDALMKEKGTGEAIVWRTNEARLKIYKNTDGATSGKAVSLRRRDDGTWYIDTLSYTKD